MGYDYNELEKYYNTRNYQGAIDYLKQFSFSNEDALVVKNEISKLKRLAAIDESTEEKLVGEDKELYYFAKGLKSGYIPHDMKGKYADGTEYETKNSYGTEYTNLINGLRTKDNKPISNIAIDIDDKDALDRLQQQLEVSDFNKELNVNVSAISDGKYRLTINRNNINLAKIYKAVNRLNSIDTAAAMSTTGVITGAIFASVAGFSSFGIGAVPAGVAGATLGASAAGLIASAMNDYEIKGLSNGSVYDISDFNFENVGKAIDLIDKANEAYDNISKRTDSVNSSSQISYSGFMSLGHANAAEALSQGLIDSDEYDDVVKAWKDVMPRYVAGASFSDKKVYVFGNEDGSTDGGKLEKGIYLDRVKNTDAENVKTEILVALKEDRCEYAMATKDGKIGTMFVITPGKEKNGEVSDEFGNRSEYIFVEDLYTDGATEYYEKDTKTKAARTNADMKKLGYRMELSNGETIGYNQGVPYKREYDADTDKYVYTPISEEQVLHSLNESNLIDAASDDIIKYYNSNTGKVEIEKDNSISELTLEDAIELSATNAINELYPKGSYSVRERTRQLVILSNNILNQIRPYITAKK